MPVKPRKLSGHDWEVYFIYPDGEDDSIAVSGCETPEEAIATARASLNAYGNSNDEQDEFEIVAVVRADAEI